MTKLPRDDSGTHTHT